MTTLAAPPSTAKNPAAPKLQFARANLSFFCLLGILGFFYAATVRPGHLWGDDFAMYVHHAENIVEGQPYAETGYIYNPSFPAYGPRMYPPVFPLLLAPLYKTFGLNLLPMKLEQIVFFLMTLVAVYSFWLRDLGRGYALAMVAILGWNPEFWAAKDNVLSDLPFLLFFYVAALLVRSAPREGRCWWIWAALIGVVVYLAMGTRSAGIALIAGVVIFDGLRYRTVTRTTGAALALCLSLQAMQAWLVGSGVGAYVGQQLHPTVQTAIVNCITYSRVLMGFWVAATQNLFSFIALAIVGILMLCGVAYQYKRGWTIVEAFLLPYLGILLVWPFAAGIRLVFPFIPWMVFLALVGLRRLAERFRLRHEAAALCGLLLLIAVPYTVAYRKMDFGPIRQDQGSREFNLLCQAVRDRTQADDVFIYFRARALSLYTKRAASTYNDRGTEQEFWDYAGKIHATYLVATSAFNDDQGFLDRCVEHNPSSVDLIYQNATFKLYRFRSRMVSGAGPR